MIDIGNDYELFMLDAFCIDDSDFRLKDISDLIEFLTLGKS